ncbi:MAG TPA: hypothetical protein VFD60_10000 [Nitrososphaeraceae archaeon]|jgi:hypothetical protein|nr:hypothetical protein [Nitrososphaeraceae archaeon]
MSEFTFFRFKSNNMLDVEEEQQNDEIIRLNEEVLEAKGIERDPRISKISEEQLREILEEDLGRKGRKLVTYNKGSTMAKKGEEEGEQREEVQYIR